MKLIVKVIGTITLGCSIFIAAIGSVEVIASEKREYRVPFKLNAGKKSFQALCSSCHGKWAEGSEQGPPLIHIYYEPSHHGDPAFLNAVTKGVRQHHWGFGDMPPVEGATEKDAIQVTRFIRWLQQQNGIN